MSFDRLREWVGKTQTMEDFAAPFPVRALAATFDEADSDPRMGDVLPPLWHWLYFLDTAPQSRIGPDGHAERGDFLPPVPLPAPRVGTSSPHSLTQRTHEPRPTI